MLKCNPGSCLPADVLLTFLRKRKKISCDRNVSSWDGWFSREPGRESCVFVVPLMVFLLTINFPSGWEWDPARLSIEQDRFLSARDSALEQTVAWFHGNLINKSINFSLLLKYWDKKCGNFWVSRVKASKNQQLLDYSKKYSRKNKKFLCWKSWNFTRFFFKR